MWNHLTLLNQCNLELLNATKFKILQGDISQYDHLWYNKCWRIGKNHTGYLPNHLSNQILIILYSVGYNNAPFIIRIVNESEHLKSMQFYLSVPIFAKINRSLRYVYPVLKQYSGKTNMNTDTCSEIRQ